MPVTKAAGDRVVGGCMNGLGLLRVQVTAIGADTVLAGIVRMVDEAQAGKLPVQKLVDRVAAVFVPGVMAVAGATFLAWIGRGRAAHRGHVQCHRRPVDRLPLLAGGSRPQ